MLKWVYLHKNKYFLSKQKKLINFIENYIQKHLTKYFTLIKTKFYSSLSFFKSPKVSIFKKSFKIKCHKIWGKSQFLYAKLFPVTKESRSNFLPQHITTNKRNARVTNFALKYCKIGTPQKLAVFFNGFFFWEPQFFCYFHKLNKRKENCALTLI